MNRNEKLIFLHHPKTGGQTLKMVLKTQYRLGVIHKVFGGHDREELGKPSLPRFHDLSEEERLGYELFMGHMPFGLHRYIPAPCRYVTILRDPIDRTVSYYHYVLARPEHPDHRFAAESETEGGVLQFAEKVELVRDGQVRMLAGGYRGNVDEKTLEQALKNLDMFVVAGLTERFDESLILMSRKLGWETPYYSKLNVNKSRPRIASLTGRVRHGLKEFNRYDALLYDEAKRRLDEAIRGEGPSLQRELRRFQGRNERIGRTAIMIQQKWHRFVRGVRRKLLGFDSKDLRLNASWVDVSIEDSATDGRGGASAPYFIQSPRRPT